MDSLSKTRKLTQRQLGSHLLFIIPLLLLSIFIAFECKEAYGQSDGQLLSGNAQ